MVFIIMEFKKRDLYISENKGEDGVIQKILSKFKEIKNRAKSEMEETRALARILTHAVKSYSKTREFDLDKKDIEFIQGQSGDVIKNLLMVVISIIPIPIPVTPFLIIFGKKIGIDITPKEHKIPEKGKKKNKTNESKKINIVITEEQYEQLNELAKRYSSTTQKLCYNQKENKPFCSLYEMRKKLSEDDKVELDVAMDDLDRYFRFKNVGMFPVIVDLALKDEGRTISYLKLISDFVWDDDYDDTETKRIINRQKNRKDIDVEDVADLTKQARTAEHQKYEQRFVGNHFEKKSTFLRLNHYCDDDAKETLFNILTQVKSEERTIDIVFDQMTRCIEKSLTQGTYYLKADIVSKKDLTHDGEVIFPSGTHFEVKKMDPFIDSYLSEFFSIFKETEKIQFKGEYVVMYNELIQRIFEWLVSNPNAEEYLNKVKSQIGGIIYEYDTIVPIEYIDLYWSNKGQRGCDEKRLSIRFRIKENTNEIKTFRYKNEDELTPIIKKVPYNEKEKVICK
jgi:hypothetical protein